MPPGHFYSPLVNPADAAVLEAIQRERQPTQTLTEVGLNEKVLVAWFARFVQAYLGNPFPAQRADGKLFYYDNPHFPLADALTLLAFVLHFRPKRVIEVGSGFSSRAMIDIVSLHSPCDTELTFIEPYPDTLPHGLADNPLFRERHIARRLQEVPLAVLEALQAGDILFIDSSHVARTGSDVLHYLFHIFPKLKPGVLVHIYDIFFPFEYPGAWIEEQNRSWNEAFFLRAYLEGNANWEVLFFFDWFFKCRLSLLSRNAPLCIPHRGGSFWMRKL